MTSQAVEAVQSKKMESKEGEVSKRADEDEAAFAKADKDDQEDYGQRIEKKVLKNDERDIEKSDPSDNQSMADVYDSLLEGKHPITILQISIAVKYLEASGMIKSDIQLSIGVINKRHEEFYPENIKRLLKDLELVMERSGLARSEALRALVEGQFEFDKQGRVLERINTVSLHSTTPFRFPL